jgi:hypothetical protein
VKCATFIIETLFSLVVASKGLKRIEARFKHQSQSGKGGVAVVACAQ